MADEDVLGVSSPSPAPPKHGAIAEVQLGARPPQCPLHGDHPSSRIGVRVQEAQLVVKSIPRVLGLVSEFRPREPARKGQEEHFAVHRKLHRAFAVRHLNFPVPIAKAIQEVVAYLVAALPAVPPDGVSVVGVPRRFLVSIGHDGSDHAIHVASCHRVVPGCAFQVEQVVEPSLGQPSIAAQYSSQPCVEPGTAYGVVGGRRPNGVWFALQVIPHSLKVRNLSPG